jgi:hypothetical protein
VAAPTAESKETVAATDPAVNELEARLNNLRRG